MLDRGESQTKANIPVKYFTERFKMLDAYYKNKSKTNSWLWIQLLNSMELDLVNMEASMNLNLP